VCGFLKEIGDQYDISYDGMLIDWFTDRPLGGRFHSMELRRSCDSSDTPTFVKGFLTRSSPYDSLLFNPDFLKEMNKNHELVDDQYKSMQPQSADRLYMEFVLENRVRRLLAVNSYGLRGDYLLVRYPFASRKLFDFFMSVDHALIVNRRLFRFYISRHFPDLSVIRSQANNRRVMQGWDEATLRQLRRKALLRHYIRRATHGIIDFEDPKHVTRYDHWLRKDRLFREFFLDNLLCQSCRESELFRKDGVLTLLKLHDRGHQLFETICGVVTYVSFVDRIRSRTI
jgi:hypothetical protein